jgi:single-strand DNA-binding protein
MHRRIDEEAPMSNHFAGRGNLGADPDLKHVEIDGEPHAVAALRIYFDRPVPDGDGGFIDKGGFWLPVNLWGPKAETIAKLLRKGARVRVEGTLVQDTWEDRETGEPASRIEVQADSIDLDLARVEAITFRAKGDGEPAEHRRDPAHRRERAPGAAC